MNTSLRGTEFVVDHKLNTNNHRLFESLKRHIN